MSTDTQPPDDDTHDFSSGSEGDLEGVTRLIGLGASGPQRDLPADAKLGDVTIVRLIAKGGMGRVYEATQGRPQRTVAVKVIDLGVVSAAVMKRFEYEAEVLGRLTHPGIAQIYTVGSQEIDGTRVPYFVMEFIPNADSLTAYARSRSLTMRDRVALFRQACDAVAHVHHKGVVHRDLKPSNILVDAGGQPKVIDFGIARPTTSDAALTTMHTSVGQLIGTLQYMSPEQFDGDPDDIDVRADIYSLGVVLWELVTGEPPYDIRGKPVFEAARIVREVDPTPPDTLRHPRHRDITLVALKCLEKDRVRRYSHARDLVDDLDRYLRGDAISVAPPTLLDSLGRLARRHRIAAAAVAGVFAAMVLAIVGITSFYVQAERERDWAEQQRRKAQAKESEAIAQRQESEKVLQFLMKTFQLPTTQAAGRDVTVRELLRMARTQLDAEYGEATGKGDMLVKAKILKAIGTSLLGLGLPFDARSCLIDSLRLLESVPGDDQTERSLCMNELARAHQACGDYAEAKDMLASTLAMKERAFGPDHIETTVGRANLATVLSALGDYDEAAAMLERARDSAERALGPSHASVATILANLGDVRYRQEDYAEAESLLKAADAIRRRVLGDEHAVTAMCLNALGDVYRCTGRFAEAEAAHAEARALDERLLNAANPQLASTLSKLGELRRVQGDVAAARPLLEEALAIRERAGLADHPETAVILHRLALVAATEGDPRGAEELFERVIALRDRRLSPSHPDTVRAVKDLARLYRDAGDEAAAEALESRRNGKHIGSQTVSSN